MRGGKPIRLTVVLIAAATLLTVGLLRSSPPQPANAAVAPAGNDIVAGPGELQAAIDRAQPGDRILVSPGRYPERITIRNGGQAGAPITITRATGTTPFITGPWQVRAPYVTVSRLIFEGSRYNDYPIWVTDGAGTDGSFFSLEYSEVRNAQLSGVFVGDTSPARALQGVAVRSCFFRDNGNTGQDHGIYIKSGSNHVVEGNLIVRSSGFGVMDSPHAQGVLIRGNKIRQNYGGGVRIQHDVTDALPMVDKTLVDGNYLKDNHGFGLSLLYNGIVTAVPPGIGNTVTNNWAAGNTAGQYGTDGALGYAAYTRGATWSGNQYGAPPPVLVRGNTVGPAAGSGGGGGSSGNQTVVDPGELQSALDAADPGDTILLNPGTYPESVTIRNGGEAGAPITITRATGNTPVLTGRWQIRAPYVTASRLVFDGSGYGDYPIWVTEGAGADDGSFFTLEDSEVRNAHLSGIFVGDTSPPMPLRGVVIRDSYFHDNGTSGSYDHGIYVKSGSNHLIQHNLIVRSSGFGIHNYPHAQDLVIRGNEIRDNGSGILIEHDLVDELPMVNHTVVDGNYLKDNGGMGISLMYAGDVSIVPLGISNTVTNNWSAGNSGGQFGRDGTLGNSSYTRGATWSGNVYGDPPGGVLVSPTAVGPNAP